MGRAIYAVGDTVKLRADPFRQAGSHGTGRIVGILPSDHGEVQYRIRLGEENCERRILASDIEASDTVAARPAAESRSSSGGNEPWFKPSSIRIKK